MLYDTKHSQILFQNTSRKLVLEWYCFEHYRSINSTISLHCKGTKKISAKLHLMSCYWMNKQTQGKMKVLHKITVEGKF